MAAPLLCLSLPSFLQCCKGQTNGREGGQGTTGKARGEKAEAQVWYRKTACMGQGLEGPQDFWDWEKRGNNSDFSQIMDTGAGICTYQDGATQLGFVQSLGSCSHLGVSETPWEVHAIASTLSCHRILGKLRQQVCGIKGVGWPGAQGSSVSGDLHSHST